MSDEEINIRIPQGPRAGQIRDAHDRNKARQIAAIDARLAVETDPETIQQLEDLKVQVQQEPVGMFIIRHLRTVVFAEERQVQKKTSEESAKIRIRQEIKDHLDLFGAI